MKDTANREGMQQGWTRKLRPKMSATERVAGSPTAFGEIPGGPFRGSEGNVWQGSEEAIPCLDVL